MSFRTCSQMPCFRCNITRLINYILHPTFVLVGNNARFSLGLRGERFVGNLKSWFVWGFISCVLIKTQRGKKAFKIESYFINGLAKMDFRKE